MLILIFLCLIARASCLYSPQLKHSYIDEDSIKNDDIEYVNFEKSEAFKTYNTSVYEDMNKATSADLPYIYFAYPANNSVFYRYQSVLYKLSASDGSNPVLNWTFSFSSGIVASITGNISKTYSVVTTQSTWFYVTISPSPGYNTSATLNISVLSDICYSYNSTQTKTVSPSAPATYNFDMTQAGPINNFYVTPFYGKGYQNLTATISHNGTSTVFFNTTCPSSTSDPFNMTFNNSAPLKLTSCANYSQGSAFVPTQNFRFNGLQSSGAYNFFWQFLQDHQRFLELASLLAMQ